MSWIETGGTVMTLAGHGADIRAIDVTADAVRRHRLRRRIGLKTRDVRGAGSTPVMNVVRGHVGRTLGNEFSRRPLCDEYCCW